MATYHLHADRNTAIREAVALGRSSHYTRGGRPPLPRCDGPKWGDSEVVQGPGVHPACPCETRNAPNPACPYLTKAAVDVDRLADGRFVVEITPIHATLRGVVIDVDGVQTTITDVGAVTLSRAELADKTTSWSG